MFRTCNNCGFAVLIGKWLLEPYLKSIFIWIQVGWRHCSSFLEKHCWKCNILVIQLLCKLKTLNLQSSFKKIFFSLLLLSVKTLTFSSHFGRTMKRMWCLLCIRLNLHAVLENRFGKIWSSEFLWDISNIYLHL